MAFTKINAAGIGTTETVTVDGLTVINDGSFGGNLTVGGVLTYEDVTNVDSVGLITARNGIVVGSGITLSKDGDIFATGITTVSGNVKVGTGITLSPDGDVFFTGIATGNGSGLTDLNASNLASGTVPTARLGSGTASSSTFLAGDSTFKTVTGTTINNNADNRVITGSDTANTLNGEANFSYDGTRCLIGTNSAAPYANRNLTVAQGSSGNTTVAIEVRSPTNGDGRIVFTDSTSDEAGAYKGQIRYDQSSDFMSFNTNGDNERLRIHSDGKMSLGSSSSASAKFYISHGNEFGLLTYGGYNYQAKFESSDAEAAIVIEDSNSGTDYNRIGVITNDMNFITNNAERLRINSDGRSYFVGATSGGYNSTTLPNGNTVNINTKVSNDGVSVIRYSGSYAAYALNIGRSKSDNIGTNSLVGDNDDLGHITWYGADGTDFNQAAAISVQVDGTPSDGTDMPGRFVFKTSANGSGTPVERVRIDSSGKVSVKTNGLNLENATATDSRAYAITNASGTTGWTFGNGVTASSHQFVIYDNSAGAARFTIDSEGKLGINKAASGCTFDVEPVNNTHAMRANGAQAGYATLICDNRDSSGTRHYISFRISNGVTGKITSTGSSTVYATTSDYRLKENVTAISDGITRLKTLKPSRFNWKADSSTTVDGFLAHEVTAVPEAVVGTKDEVDSDNNPVYQAIDEGKLVPLLTAALQEAIAKIETLETKVAALEG